jgi:hypothetical protein
LRHLVFEAADGKTYAVIPRGNIDIQEINLQAMKLLGEPKRIITMDNSDIGAPTSPAYLEGL